MTDEKRIGRSVFAALCAAALSLGNVFCLKTALCLTGEERPIFLACVLAAACAAILLTLPKGSRWLAGICGAAVLLGLWKRKILIASTLRAAKQAFLICGKNDAHMAVIGRRIMITGDPSPTVFLAALGALLAILTAATVCRRWMLIPLGAFSGALFSACMFNLDPAPAAWAVALLAGAYGSLALTQARRRRDTDRPFEPLALGAVVTVLLIMLLLFVRPSDYVYPAWPDRAEEKLWEWGDKLSILWDEMLARMGIHYGSREGWTLIAPATARAAQETDLRVLTARSNTKDEVFTVMTDTAEDLYLRGSAYSTYTGDKWKKLGGSDEGEGAAYRINARFWISALQEKRLRIESEAPMEVLYLPYGSAELPEGARPVEDAYVFNAGDLMQYEIPYGGFSVQAGAVPDGKTVFQDDPAGSYFIPLDDTEAEQVWRGAVAEMSWFTYQSMVMRADTALPEGTRDRLLALLRERGVVPDERFLLEAPYQIEFGDYFSQITQLPDGPVKIHVTGADGQVHQITLNNPSNMTREEWEETNQDRSEYRRAMAEAVAALVRKQGKYDLAAPSMPRKAGDFALWFMTEGETGYCVHYASAAAALLRALNVPARFVTGYLVNTTAGRWTTVTQSDAHAWAEYYIDGEGWIPLETTPGAATRAALSHPRIRLDRPNREFIVDDLLEDDRTDPASDRPDLPEGTDPQHEVSGNDAEAAPRAGLRGWLKVFLAAAGILALWQGILRLWRRRVLNRGGVNHRAEAWYRHICLLARLSGTPVSDELEQIALRARFSQHTVTEEEMRVLRERADALREWLLTGNPVKAFLYRLLLAL